MLGKTTYVRHERNRMKLKLCLFFYYEILFSQFLFHFFFFLLSFVTFDGIILYAVLVCNRNRNDNHFYDYDFYFILAIRHTIIQNYEI